MSGAPDAECLVPSVVLPGEECDHGACPSTVQVSITLPGDLVLGFCAHHGRQCHRQMNGRGLLERVGDLKV
jgi:hypothetical protein